MRDALLKEIFETNLTKDLANDAWHPSDRGLGSFQTRVEGPPRRNDGPETITAKTRRHLGPTVVSRALAKGVPSLTETLGEDFYEWHGNEFPKVRPKHNLSAAFPELAEFLTHLPSLPAVMATPVARRLLISITSNGHKPVCSPIFLRPIELG
ncbi:MAG: hypothetical protein CM1200mP27_10860 [Chloroflexota bacterium]|nr:MAG: hypothetical protein CM1200mP27_10860 [Chloroflexota bacterium]